MKVKKRDVMFFILGILTYFIVDTIMNLDDAKRSFKEGYDSVRKIESAD